MCKHTCTRIDALRIVSISLGLDNYLMTTASESASERLHVKKLVRTHSHTHTNCQQRFGIVQTLYPIHTHIHVCMLCCWATVKAQSSIILLVTFGVGWSVLLLATTPKTCTINCTYTCTCTITCTSTCCVDTCVRHNDCYFPKR